MHVKELRVESESEEVRKQVNRLCSAPTAAERTYIIFALAIPTLLLSFPHLFTFPFELP